MTARFMDTRDVFRADYRHSHIHGSSSIKKVLPSLVPEMTYKGMAVANGGEAMNAFDVLYFDRLSAEQAAQLRKDLLSYCKQDTRAMVKLVEKLKDCVG